MKVEMTMEEYEDLKLESKKWKDKYEELESLIQSSVEFHDLTDPQGYPLYNDGIEFAIKVNEDFLYSVLGVRNADEIKPLGKIEIVKGDE